MFWEVFADDINDLAVGTVPVRDEESFVGGIGLLDSLHVGCCDVSNIGKNRILWKM